MSYVKPERGLMAHFPIAAQPACGYCGEFVRKIGDKAAPVGMGFCAKAHNDAQRKPTAATAFEPKQSGCRYWWRGRDRY